MCGNTRMERPFYCHPKGLRSLGTTGRVPRKLKKKFKRKWEAEHGQRIKIKRRSIRKSSWGSSARPVWGCQVYPW